ncbi:MAG TPA: isochorismatase family cysteine hydrolase [Gammaproteobacteria bacterium]
MPEGLRERGPGKARKALLLIDVINALEFDGGDQLLPSALEMADCIVALKDATYLRNVPTIYVNDNFSRWQSNFDLLVESSLESGVKGAPVIRKLVPDARDYHVLKPHQSGFFGTPLSLLLEHLEVSDLILAGLTTDRCVMFTAIDAYMRGYRIGVPSDCCAAIERRHHEDALGYIERVLKADVRPWADQLGRE